jgi:hypothetical protein
MLPVGGRPPWSSSSTARNPKSSASPSRPTTSREKTATTPDGSEFGVDIAYVNEDAPMGTAVRSASLTDVQEPLS